jgi:transcription initiation factor TFIIB
VLLFLFKVVPKLHAHQLSTMNRFDPIYDTSPVIYFIMTDIHNEQSPIATASEDICPECGSLFPLQDQERGESICTNCGLVLDHHIADASNSGRRAFSAEEKSQREQNGGPVTALLPDIGLATVIDTNDPRISNRMKRIIKWNTRMTWSNRNMLIAVTEIKRIGSLLNVPLRVKELAAKIYRKAFNLKLLRGRSIKAMVVATLYYACRSEHIPRTLQEIMRLTDSDGRDVRRCYRTILKEMKLSVPAIDTVCLVPKYTSGLELSNEVEQTVVKIITAYEKRYCVGGKDPKGLIAAAIYVACVYHRVVVSQSRIARTVGVTEVTLRSRYKEIMKHIPQRPQCD